MAYTRPISWFYQHTLGVSLNNVRNSWGAFDPDLNRVFLRLWRDCLQRTENGDRILVLLDDPPTKPPGYFERVSHLELMRRGIPGFGIVCVAKDVSDPVRKIVSYDDKRLLALGELVHEEDRTYAAVLDWVSVKTVRSGQ
jgi:hypothetical protein